MMHCPACQHENREEAKFCEACGVKLMLACSSCGARARTGAVFCDNCGASLKAKAKGKNQKVKGKKPQPLSPKPRSLVPNTQRPAGERRQLTVMFCDLVGSTALSSRLDPEELRTVVQGYQRSCSEVIRRFDGYVAQYLGDGLLVYFGYPTAHEDDARRAVRASLDIVETLRSRIPSPLVGEEQGEGTVGAHGHAPLQVRIGIHTGLVVISEIGAGGKREQLALGETPNLAARIQGLAEPNTVLISAATQRLVTGQFECQPFGSHLLKGIDAPISVYHVQSERQSVSPLAGKATLTPLVGREQEVGLLLDRWEQVKEGRGQVVLLSGEPGIGKSRLAFTLKEHVTNEGALFYEVRCSSYHQQSALHPLIESFQRTLLFTRQDTDEEKVEKLERALILYNMQESFLLFAALLSLPAPSHYPALNFTPQKQKERTLQALVQLFTAQAERQATVLVWEDLHWADPSSLEFLSLLVEQLPTTKLLLLLTFRPEFTLPWKPRSHLSQLVLNRLGKKQVETMIEKAAVGATLPSEVIQQILVKTDGVPLFVEELTKSVVETVGAYGRTPLHLSIPATLQEALLARLDRLSDARQVAQLGATLGREFSYELIQAVAPFSETELHAALTKLVEAEILYQRGVGEQARYFFKHALIQDTAYQSLLKSTRQQYHQQIARVLEERFPEIKEHQPELLAHHYTEANLIERAIPYWQQAGQRAVQHSANIEAISHFIKGLELLKTLPNTPERTQQELTLQIALIVPLVPTKGYASADIGCTYTRALELCQQIGETPQFFPVLLGMVAFRLMRAEVRTARELAEQCFRLVQRVPSPTRLMWAHNVMGQTLFCLGEIAVALDHLEQGIVLYDPQKHKPLVSSVGLDAKVSCLCFAAWAHWLLGYPEQALKKINEALTLARELSHSYSLAYALYVAARLHQLRREWQVTQDWAEALMALSSEHRFPGSEGTILRGWTLAEQGQGDEGIMQIHKGLAAYRPTGAEAYRPYFLALLAEAYEKVGQIEEGLTVLAEALTLVNKTGERWCEAELHRLKGELTLQSQVESYKSKVEEAESCFLKAIDVARKQQAKSLELRAVTSLARLWKGQGKPHEARYMLSEIYNWFTEGFDTKDLQEAKTLLDELNHWIIDALKV